MSAEEIRERVKQPTLRRRQAFRLYPLDRLSAASLSPSSSSVRFVVDIWTLRERPQGEAVDFEGREGLVGAVAVEDDTSGLEILAGRALVRLDGVNPDVVVAGDGQAGTDLLDRTLEHLLALCGVLQFPMLQTRSSTIDVLVELSRPRSLVTEEHIHAGSAECCQI